MSLHGTLETFALPDVLALLAATKKTGELRVVGGKTDGRVWFDGGAVVGADVGRAVGYVDAVFELLRLETGKFSFDAEKAADAPAEPSSIEPLLAEAQARLTEWRAIEAVIPSVDHGVRLAAEITDPHVMVTGAQWRALVGVSASPTVSAVIDCLGTGEFDTCRTLKELVETGLLTVEERAVTAAPAPAPAPEPVAEVEPAPAAVIPDPDPEPQPVPEPEPIPAPAPEPAAEAPSIPVQLEPTASADRPKISALTSTPAAEAALLEQQGPAGEADELVRQVAAMEAPAAPESTPEPAPVAEPEAAAEPEPTPETAPAQAESAPDAEEPINRGLLLKFLSSVRT